jgi:hypothetical protein
VKRDFRRRQPMSYRSRAEPDLVLNSLPLTLSTEEFAGSLLPFGSSDQSVRLRADHARTHVFRRRDNEVACVPLRSETPPIGELTSFQVRRSTWAKVRSPGARCR